MFTGLVESLGEIRDVIVAGDGTDLVVAAGIGSELTVGESVAVNGACLTVVERGRDTFRFQAGPETLRRTNLGQLRVGDSLTLVEVLADRFSVALIPHTLVQITLGFKKVGDAVNLETDIIAKYVGKLVK